MACLKFTITPVLQAYLLVSATAASLSIETTAMAGVNVTPAAQVSAKVTPVPKAELTVATEPQAQLTIGEVCTVSPGTIVVLAASDGPLRTRDGGYFLLNPATN